jgi:hypothetical protein
MATTTMQISRPLVKLDLDLSCLTEHLETNESTTRELTDRQNNTEAEITMLKEIIKEFKLDVQDRFYNMKQKTDKDIKQVRV